MPRRAFDDREATSREDRFSRGEILTLVFTKSANNPLALNAAEFASFVADKDYAIRAVHMSAIATEVTTAKRGLVALSLQSLNGIDLFGAVSVFKGNVIAALPFKSEASTYLEYGADNEKECVYLEKGKSIFAHLRNESADGVSSCTITVRLLPVGKQ